MEKWLKVLVMFSIGLLILLFMLCNLGYLLLNEMLMNEGVYYKIV